MPKYKQTIQDRFSDKYIIRPSGCWEWDGALRADGYGILKVNGKCLGAHRFSYELHIGPIPLNEHVLHDCDNTRCVNPGHLYTGTPAQNIEDRMSRGRYRIPFNPANILKISKECKLPYSKYYDYIETTIKRFMRINKLARLDDENINNIISLIKSIPNYA